MSQDLRDYDLLRLDKVDSEAGRMGITATVGPTGDHDIDTRGVQITLETPNGVAYARVSEPQVCDLIETLESRIDDEDKETEATMWGAKNPLVLPSGEFQE